MTYRPLPIVTARNLLYALKVINEAIVLNKPKTLAEAKLLLSNFEMITSEAIGDAEGALEVPTAA